jgi:hypothetical protein
VSAGARAVAQVQICEPEVYGQTPLSLFREYVRVVTRQGFDKGALAVVHVPGGTYRIRAYPFGVVHRREVIRKA